MERPLRNRKQLFTYNSGKRGIDISEHLASYHTSVRNMQKSLRWYHKVAEELIFGTAVVNAFLMFNTKYGSSDNSGAMQITEFREKIVLSLLKTGNTSPPVERTHHFIQMCDEKEEGKRTDRRKRRYCVGCRNTLTELHGRAFAKQTAKRVVTECAGCAGNPIFCYYCFPRYHS